MTLPKHSKGKGIESEVGVKGGNAVLPTKVGKDLVSNEQEEEYRHTGEEDT